MIHSKQYRRPEYYSGKCVLIIGAGTSGMDIAHDLSGHVQRLIISSRIDPTTPPGYQRFRDGQRHRGPLGVESTAQVSSFKVQGNSPRDGHIHRVDGTVVTGVDIIIFCTGYQYSFPFLKQLRQPPSSVPDDRSLLIDGDYVHNLYRDVFYIPDPTLAFVGISVNTSAFSFFEYQSISVARVFSGKARLPTKLEQRQRFRSVVSRKGAGKFRHFLGREGERAYVRETVEWLNQDAAELDADPVEGHTKEWLWESDQNLIKLKEKLGLDIGSFGDLSGDLAPVPLRESPLQTRIVVQ
jgi:cation diffusion facilitator CzcD-associated flavoprotein CzcO